MAKTVARIAPGGAVGVAVVQQHTTDRSRIRAAITADVSYPTGGYPITPQDLGFGRQIDYLDIVNEGISVWGSSWNRATQKLQLYVLSTGAEVANAVDVHTFSCDVVAEGL